MNNWVRSIGIELRLACGAFEERPPSTPIADTDSGTKGAHAKAATAS